MVIMASGISCGRVHTTTMVESLKMATMLQIIGWQRHAALVYHVLFWLYDIMLWSIDTCQIKLSADFLWRCKSLPPPPNILEIPIKVQFSVVMLVSTLFEYSIWVVERQLNVNSSIWTKNLVTQLDEELINNHNYTDVMFVDGTSLPFVATFRNKYIAVVSTKSKFLSNTPL